MTHPPLLRALVHRGIAAVVAAVLMIEPPLHAQTPPPPQPATQASAKLTAYRYRLLGVYDEQSGEPIEGVEVSDILNGNGSLTSSTGTLSLFFLPDGGGIVRLRKIGYVSQMLTVSISPADTNPITVVISRAAQLPTVVVKDSALSHLSPHMRAFEEHRKTGFGSFITEAELRKNDNRNFANVLAAHLAGLQQVPAKTSATYLVSSRKPCKGSALAGCRTPNCYVRVYTDGVLTWDSSMGISSLPDFARISVEDYAAVEFYAGGDALPPGISPLGADCGTLVLYTRER
ncbi:MAG: hypothetical protein ABI442_22590 [Gemmatimonadaceae bacterium]